VPEERRGRIWSAIREGRLLHDPEDARLLLRVLGDADVSPAGFSSWRRRVTGVFVLAVLGYEVITSLLGNLGHGIPTAAAAFSFAVIVVQLTGHLRGRKRSGNADRARALNRTYLEQLGEPLSVDEATGMSGEASAPRTVRWSLRLAVLLLLLSLPLVAVLAAAPSKHMPFWWVLAAVAACLIGLSLAAVAALLGLQTWRSDRGVRSRLESALVVLLGCFATVAWIAGLIDVVRRS